MEPEIIEEFSPRHHPGGCRKARTHDPREFAENLGISGGFAERMSRTDAERQICPEIPHIRKKKKAEPYCPKAEHKVK
jgi:hypothetical protein